MKFVAVAVPGRVAPGSDGSELLRSIGGKEGIASVLRNPGTGKSSAMLKHVYRTTDFEVRLRFNQQFCGGRER